MHDETLIFLAFFGLTFALALAGALRWWTWRPLMRRRAVVQTDAATFEGVVVSRRGPLLVLADASTRVGGEPRSLDGQVVIERARVAWVQVVS